MPKAPDDWCFQAKINKSGLKTDTLTSEIKLAHKLELLPFDNETVQQGFSWWPR